MGSTDPADARSVSLPQEGLSGSADAATRLVVDTHTHVISADLHRHPLRVADYPGVEWVHEAPVTAEELLSEMTAAGVGRALLVQAQGAYGTDNSYVVEARARHPEVFGAVAIVDDPAQLASLAAAGVGGVRLFAIAGGAALQDRRMWQAARAEELRVSAATLPEHLPALAEALHANPDMCLALDHCGFAAEAVEAYASHPNLYLKVTPHVLDVADPSAALERLAEAFGVERLMWGSDYSQTHDRPYAELVAQARTACAGLSPHEQERFLGGTALALWPELA